MQHSKSNMLTKFTDISECLVKMINLTFIPDNPLITHNKSRGNFKMKMMPSPSDRQSTELSEVQKRELEATYYSMIRKITSLTINEAILIEQLRAQYL
jgi:hypothetical protein